MVTLGKLPDSRYSDPTNTEALSSDVAAKRGFSQGLAPIFFILGCPVSLKRVPSFCLKGLIREPKPPLKKGIRALLGILASMELLDRERRPWLHL